MSDHGCLHEVKIHGTGMCSYVRHFSVQRKRSVSWTDFKKCGNGNWLLLEGCAKWCNLLALKQAKCHCMYTLSVCIVAVEEEGKPLFALTVSDTELWIAGLERKKSAAWYTENFPAHSQIFMHIFWPDYMSPMAAWIEIFIFHSLTFLALHFEVGAVDSYM